MQNACVGRAVRPRHRLTSGVALMVAIASMALVHPADVAAWTAKTDSALIRTATAAPSSRLALIVRETAPGSDAAETLVRSLGGTVDRELSILGGFAAHLPARGLDQLLRSVAIARVWRDGQIHVNQVNMGGFDTWAPNTVWRQTVRIPQAWGFGGKTYKGKDVTVALLDTGISRVPDLGDRVLARVDFTPDHDGYDRYGHGTHLAGIIAGDGTSSGGKWAGVAPAADLVSVKVAGADGSTDVSVVLAGLQWVVSHQDEYDIRVLNLSFGTDSTQSYLVDPLDYAVERVWFSGILVVVSAGNRGSGAGTINKPGDDPYVVTVGAADLKNTIDRGDDQIAPFSSQGPTAGGFAKPEVSAPGVTLVSTRDVGGTVDTYHPAARVGDAYFKGTGTSQAAAVVSGVAALMFQANSSLTPDIAKAILIKTAQTNGTLKAAGLVDAAGAIQATLQHTMDGQPANVGLTPSTGLGSLEASRGSFHVYADLNGDGSFELVTGEVDVLGQTWDASAWTGRSWSEDAWESSVWSEYVAELEEWEGRSWSGRSWSGSDWDGRSWSNTDWTSSDWSGGTWG